MEQVRVERLDHLGLIASVIKDLLTVRPFLRRFGKNDAEPRIHR